MATEGGQRPIVGGHQPSGKRDIDLAVIHALGFPAFRGGLLAWADSLGAAEIVRRVDPLAALGSRMTPPARLLELARTGGRFTVD